MNDDAPNILPAAWRLTGPWILYDGTCPICRGGAASFAPILRRRAIRLATLQSPIGQHFANDGTDEMKVVTLDARVLGGAEAIAYISRFIWWARPVQWLWALRPLRPVLRRTYAWVARHRHCTPFSCSHHDA